MVRIAAAVTPLRAPNARFAVCSTSAMPTRKLSTKRSRPAYRLGERTGHQGVPPRLGGRLPLVWQGVPRFRCVVEDHRADVDRRDPVDDGVMRLGQHREAVTGQALDEVHLP